MKPTAIYQHIITLCGDYSNIVMLSPQFPKQKYKRITTFKQARSSTVQFCNFAASFQCHLYRTGIPLESHRGEGTLLTTKHTGDGWKRRHSLLTDLGHDVALCCGKCWARTFLPALYPPAFTLHDPDHSKKTQSCSYISKVGLQHHHVWESVIQCGK